MDAYLYQADLHCEACAKEIMADRKDYEPGYLDAQDSDFYPKGPYADGGGEADSPQHCAACGVFLDNPLTERGSIYVKNAWRLYVDEMRGNVVILVEWRDAYVCEWTEWCQTTEEEDAAGDLSPGMQARFLALADG